MKKNLLKLSHLNLTKLPTYCIVLLKSIAKRERKMFISLEFLSISTWLCMASKHEKKFQLLLSNIIGEGFHANVILFSHTLALSSLSLAAPSSLNMFNMNFTNTNSKFFIFFSLLFSFLSRLF